jgi:hypothetical protein
MTDREKKLLIALAGMVEQYLDSYEDEVDTLSMSAGEHAERTSGVARARAGHTPRRIRTVAPTSNTASTSL